MVKQNFYAILLTDKGETKFVHDIAETRFDAVCEAENICVKNEWTLQGVYPYRNAQKEPETLSKGNIERNRGKNFVY